FKFAIPRRRQIHFDMVQQSIASCFASIKTEHVLAPQVMLDRLEHRCKIHFSVRIESGFRITNPEIAPASFVRQGAKALRRRARHESSFLWREQREMNHVK